MRKGALAFACLAACGGAPKPRPLPEPDALVARLPEDAGLASRLGLGAREQRPRSAAMLHRTEDLAVIEARTESGGVYLVVLDHSEGGWSVAGSVLAAETGVERVRVVHATAPDATDIAVEGEKVGLWHLAPEPRPGLRQILAVDEPGELVVQESAEYPRPVRVGEALYAGGPEGYAPSP